MASFVVVVLFGFGFMFPKWSLAFIMFMSRPAWTMILLIMTPV
jgi:hypothetical protein